MREGRRLAVTQCICTQRCTCIGGGGGGNREGRRREGGKEGREEWEQNGVRGGLW